MGMVSDADLKKIIEEGDNEVLIGQAEHVGKALANTRTNERNRLSASQIRSIFGSVRRIEMDWLPPSRHPDPVRVLQAQREFALLQPRLAYQAKREQSKGRGVLALSEVLTQAMQKVEKDYDRFRNFVDFFEAILAYHKANSDKD